MKRIALALAFTGLVPWIGVALAEDGRVARAQFTTAIEDREPVDRVEGIDTAHDDILFFTELQGLEGTTVTHRWLYGGEVRGEVEFEVGGPRWRVWSSKDLVADWTGPWTVVVLDGEGGNLGLWSFEYTEQAAEMGAETSASDSE